MVHETVIIRGVTKLNDAFFRDATGTITGKHRKDTKGASEKRPFDNTLHLPRQESTMADRFDDATQVRVSHLVCWAVILTNTLERATGIPRAGAGTGARPAVDSYIHQHVLGQVRSRPYSNFPLLILLNLAQMHHEHALDPILSG